LESEKMGFLDFLFGGHRAKYGRLIAWMEHKYGRIDKEWGQSRMTHYMNDVLSREKTTIEEKKIAGLRRYVESQKFLGLVKDENR